MSKREIKVGQRVWDAFIAVCARQTFGGVGGAWTRQVAEKAGVSKPTAQKYLTIACERGAIVREDYSYNGFLWLRR